MKIGNKVKFSLAIIVAIGMLCAGCEKTDPVVATFGDKKISLNFYKAFARDALFVVMDGVDPKQNAELMKCRDISNCLKFKINGGAADGKTVEEAVQEKTRELVNLFVGTEVTFAEEKLELPEAVRNQNKNMESNLKEFEKKPVKTEKERKEKEEVMASFADMIEMTVNRQKFREVFNRRTSSISDEEIFNFVKNNFVAAWVVPFSSAEPSKKDEKAAADAVSKAKADAEKFAAEVNKRGKGGPGFLEVLFVEYKNAEKAREKLEKEQLEKEQKAKNQEKAKELANQSKSEEAAKVGGENNPNPSSEPENKTKKKLPANANEVNSKAKPPTPTDEDIKKQIQSWYRGVFSKKELLQVFDAEELSKIVGSPVCAVVLKSKAGPLLVVMAEPLTADDCEKNKERALIDLKNEEIRQQLIKKGEENTNWNARVLAANPLSVLFPPEVKQSEKKTKENAEKGAVKS